MRVLASKAHEIAAEGVRRGGAGAAGLCTTQAGRKSAAIVQSTDGKSNEEVICEK